MPHLRSRMPKERARENARAKYSLRSNTPPEGGGEESETRWERPKRVSVLKRISAELQRVGVCDAHVARFALIRACGCERVKKDHRAVFVQRVLVHAPSCYGDAPVAHFSGHMGRVECGERVWPRACEADGYSGSEQNEAGCTDGAGAVPVRNPTREYQAYLKLIYTNMSDGCEPETLKS